MKRIPFNPDLCSTTKFVTMTSGAQALFFHSLTIADPDGLIDRDTAITSANSNAEAMNELIANGYVLDLGDVIAITHWNIHNLRKTSRQADTIYPEAREKLGIKSGVYYIK